MFATEERTQDSEQGTAGSAFVDQRALAGLPLLVVSAAFFAAATIVVVRGGTAGAGLPLWFPLAVCGGISAAGAVALLLFSGGLATGSSVSSGSVAAADRRQGLEVSEAGPAEAFPPSAPTTSSDAVRVSPESAPEDPLLLPAGRFAGLTNPSVASSETMADILDGTEGPGSGVGRLSAVGPSPLGPAQPGIGDGSEARGSPNGSVPPGVATARRTPADPVHMNLGEFVQALQARVATPRPGSAGSARPASSAPATPPSPGASSATLAPADPSHLRCAECGSPVPGYPAPGRCPACGRPMCGSCQVASVNSGAFGRCRECRTVVAPLATPA
jgi:hypothetical protein